MKFLKTFQNLKDFDAHERKEITKIMTHYVPSYVIPWIVWPLVPFVIHMARGQFGNCEIYSRESLIIFSLTWLIYFSTMYLVVSP